MKCPQVCEYPPELHVNEETYTVKFVSRMPKGQKGAVGLCDPGSHIIYIKKGLTSQQTFRTFVHEWLHAIEFEYEIKIKHKEVYQLEKAIVDSLLANF